MYIYVGTHHSITETPNVTQQALKPANGTDRSLVLFNDSCRKFRDVFVSELFVTK
jgi:hypothetical protein